MLEGNRETVEKANALLAGGKQEEFLALCAEDVEWTLLSKAPSKMTGRDAIRKFMAATSKEGSEPPKFKVDEMIAHGEFVVAYGDMTMTTKEGETVKYVYFDIHRFEDGKIAELRTFVNKTQAETNKQSSAAA